MGRASPAGLWGPQGHSHSLPSGRSKPGPCFIGCPLGLTGMFLPSLLPTPAGGGRIQFYHPAVRPDGPPPGGHATDGVCRGRRGIDQPSHHEQRGFRQPFESQSLPGRVPSSEHHWCWRRRAGARESRGQSWVGWNQRCPAPLGTCHGQGSGRPGECRLPNQCHSFESLIFYKSTAQPSL